MKHCKMTYLLMGPNEYTCISKKDFLPTYNDLRSLKLRLKKYLGVFWNFLRMAYLLVILPIFRPVCCNVNGLPKPYKTTFTWGGKFFSETCQV